MSLKDKASLIFKPSRYKSGKAYSFRGEDFTFTRSSVATRVNASGLIEDVASDVPRLNYDPTDLTKCPTLLLEPSKTNLIAHSQLFDSWTKEDTSVLYNSGIAPDGTNTASKLVPNSTSIDHSVYKPGSSWTTHTFSVFAKALDYGYIYVGKNNNYDTDGVFFDLRTGVIAKNTSALTATIEDYGNGWYRCAVYGNISYALICPSQNGTSFVFAGDGSKGILVWGGQVEASSSYPSSYIRTSSSTVTRAIDLAKKTSASSIIGQTEGTIYVEFEYTGVKDNYSPLFSLQGVGSPMELIEIYAGVNGTTYSAVMQDGGVTQFVNAFTPSLGKNKVAFAYATNNSVLVVNGVVIGAVDTACTIPTLYDIGLGAFTYSNSYSLGDSINEALLFKQRLSDAELLSLTSYDDYAELVERNDLTWGSPTITNNRITALKEL